jgi:MFS family permease
MSNGVPAAIGLPPAAGASDARAGKAARGAVARGGWLMLFVLTVVYVVSFIDRGALSLIVGPIKQDLGASDLEISLLLGLSFMLLYSALGIPAGYLVDLYRRKALLGGAILCWSAMQVMCGLSQTYWQLFLARIGLGVGEAVLPPAASSMIRDAFPPERRSLAFSIYNMGPMLGGGLALLLGGLLLQFAAGGGLAGIPVLASMKPWQFVLVVPGLIGIPLALVTLLLREPPRRIEGAGAAVQVSYRDAVRYAWSRRGTYGPLWIAICLYGIAIGSQLAWLPEAVARTMNIGRPVIGQTLGMINLVAAPVGLVFWGSFADWLQKRGWVDAPVRVAIGSTAVAALVTATYPFIHDPAVGAIAYAAQTFFFVIFAAAGGATMANLTPGNMMGKLTAIYYLVTNVLGLALGPTVIALVARIFFDGPRAIGLAYDCCYVIAVALAGLMLSRVCRSLRATASLPKNTD